MKAIDRYIDLIGEVLTLYQCYDIVNLQIQGLDYIKDLQYRLQTFDIDSIEFELIDDYPDPIQLKRRLEFLEMKLSQNNGTTYLVEFPISISDWLGDGKKRETFIYKQLKENGGEYVLRLHSILSQVNQHTQKLIQLSNKLRPLVGIQENSKDEVITNQPNLTLPNILNTDRAQKYFSKAIEAGVIVQKGEKYQKRDISKAQLAYFLDLVFCRNNDGKYNHKNFPDKQLSNLFKESRLGQTLRQCIDNKNTDGKPKGYETIDELFK